MISIRKEGGKKLIRIGYLAKSAEDNHHPMREGGKRKISGDEIEKIRRSTPKKQSNAGKRELTPAVNRGRGGGEEVDMIRKVEGKKRPVQ